ncbi:hypothetical protein, partial [Streptococcus pneumoniae]|uniref:hypothetical protein n=1 Tax=Streptococcus pneumoniae TaxID=1313 RepID=UPI0018B0A29D
ARLIEWISFDLDPDLFWMQTPIEYRLRLDGVSKRFEREHQGRVWLAWHIAALPKIKTFPALDKLMGVKPRRQTQEEIERNLR